MKAIGGIADVIKAWFGWKERETATEAGRNEVRVEAAKQRDNEEAIADAARDDANRDHVNIDDDSAFDQSFKRD